MSGPDHFVVMGLPRRYAVDREELERRFRDLSRQLHPDRFARAEPRERRLALERATRLNDAYRTLRDPRRRAEHLLHLAGHDAIAGGRVGLPDPEFLEEQLAIREALAEARASGDVPTQLSVGARARAALRRIEEEIASLFVEHETGSGDALTEIARRVIHARYYDQVVAEVEGAEASGG